MLIFVGDMLLTAGALATARCLRTILPCGLQADPITFEKIKFEIDWPFYLIVLGVWSIVFLILPVYNSQRLATFEVKRTPLEPQAVHNFTWGLYYDPHLGH
jgi:hypothetical protein